MGELGCLLGEMDTLTNILKVEKKINLQKQLIKNEIIPLRQKSIDKWNEMYNYLLAKVNTPGGLGTIANLELHNLQGLKMLTKNDSLYQTILQGTLPEVQFQKTYTGKSRIIVPAKRTVIESNEDFNLKVTILSKNKVKEGKLFYSELGKNSFIPVEFKNMARSVYSVTISKNELNKMDFEYYIEFYLENEKIVYPSGAPDNTRTVIIID